VPLIATVPSAGLRSHILHSGCKGMNIDVKRYGEIVFNSPRPTRDEVKCTDLDGVAGGGVMVGGRTAFLMYAIAHHRSTELVGDSRMQCTQCHQSVVCLFMIVPVGMKTNMEDWRKN